jgi:hypothetical protein
MIITLAGAGIQLSAHGAFRQLLVKSTFDTKKNGHRHTSGNVVIEKIVRRRAIVALAQAKVDSTVITTFIGTSKSSFYRWNNRCAQANNYKDLPRSGRPSFYTEDVKLKVIAFYCQKRPLSGCGQASQQFSVFSLITASSHIGHDISCT